jgi:hypothetical protein
MEDPKFAFFMFGITSLVFLSLLLFSYIIFTFILKDDEFDINENNLPNNLKIDFEKINKLIDFQIFNKLSNDEKITYILSKIYLKFNNKPILIPNELNSSKITTESLLIRDRGINSFYFQDYYDQIQSLIDQLQEENDNDDDDDDNDNDDEIIINENTSLLNTNNNNNNNNNLSKIEINYQKNNFLKLLKLLNYKSIIPKRPPFIIEDLIEINFKPNKINKFSYSTLLNLPIPTVNRKTNVTYFECKLLQFNKNSTLISIGLTSNSNYPNFQLPGYLPYSFAIESSGNLRLTTKNNCQLINDIKDNNNNDNNELIVLPQLNEGDVIGLGYRSISGTIFLTHNGKLIHEIIKYFKFQLYPIIGFKNINNNNNNNNNNRKQLNECKINVNLGQLGFVYIEANVKKLGFCENKNDGLIGAPPIYNKLNLTNEILLAKGDDIPPNYPNSDSFFGPTIVGSSKDEKNELEIKQNDDEIESIPSSHPPSYESEKTSNVKKNINEMNDEEYEILVSTNINKDIIINKSTTDSEINQQPIENPNTIDKIDKIDETENLQLLESSSNNTSSNLSKNKNINNKSKSKKSNKRKNKKKSKTLF